MTRPTIVLASRNAKKAEELRRILASADLDVEVVGAEQFSDMSDVPETEATFAGNSAAKAAAVALHTGLIAVADDSGLCVDALNGMPGILSARWAGGHGDDEANLRLVLEQLSDVPDERRGAAFRCAATAARPGADGAVEFLTAEGELAGTIVRQPRGTNGFGYDPIFRPDGLDQTTAELPSGVKDRISHRGRALARLADELRRWL